MVRGIDKFKEKFAQYADNYVIIGGTACEIHEEMNIQVPRATKDIDIILIVEALSSEFVEKFWEFIKEGRYSNNQTGETKGLSKHQYYRFKNPEYKEYPMQLELFSRNIGIIKSPEDIHLTPIPINEDLSSLSAILMDDAYYNYTIEHSQIQDHVHIANIESLICLKCKAYLEMVGNKVNADSRHIKKHRNDIFRLGAMLVPEIKYVLPKKIEKDISQFCEMIANDMPDENLFKAANIRGVNVKMILDIIKSNFIS